MTLRHLLMASVIVLCPFQDTFLRGTPLRQLGCSFAVLPLLALVALDVAEWLAGANKRVNLRVVAVAAYCVLLNCAYLAGFGSEWSGISLYGKSVNIGLTVLLAAYVVFRPDWAAFPYLRPCVHAAFAIALAGVLLKDLNVLGLRSLVANPIFHFTVNPDTRWHGLSSEASILSLAIGSLGLLSAACARTKTWMLILLALTSAVLALSGSKGGVLTLAGAGLAVGLVAKGHRRHALACIVLFLPFGYLGYLELTRMSAIDVISQTTTFATRAALAAWSMEVLVHHPLGVGFAGFYPALTEYLPEAMNTIFKLSDVPLNFDEVTGYVSSAQYAGTKTLLLDLAVYLGIPFLIAFAICVRRMIRACLLEQRITLMAALFFVTIAACTYNGSLVLYNTFLVYGVCWSLARRATH